MRVEHLYLLTVLVVDKLWLNVDYIHHYGYNEYIAYLCIFL